MDNKNSAAKFASTLCIFLLSSPASAVTWDELRTSALTGNRTLQQSNLDLRRSEETVSGSRSGYYPTLRAALSANRSIDPAPQGSSTSNRIGVTASQNLFAGLADMNGIRKAEADRRALEAAKVLASATLRSGLRRAFDNALYLQDALAFAIKTVARRSENVRIVDLRYEGGRENKSSALKTQAARLAAEADEAYYRASLNVSRAELSNFIGRAIADSERFEGTFSDSPSETSTGSSSSHPKISQAEAERAAAAAHVVQSRAGWLPELTADASAFKAGEGTRLGADPHYSVGMTLTVPLFTPAQNSRYAESTFALSKAELAVAQTRSEVELALKRAEISFADAKLRQDVAAKVVEAARMQAEVYRQRYTLGMISFQDWDAAEAEFIKAEKDLLTARLNLADAGTEADFARGRTLEEPGS